jgi:hypothetical protein
LRAKQPRAESPLRSSFEPRTSNLTLPWFFAAAVFVLLAGCRSTQSPNESPLAPGTPLDHVHAIRSLMRVRATHGDRTQSFKAQLLVEPATHRVELVAYTPLNTSAATLYADRDLVVFLNHIDHTAWQGSAGDVALFGHTEPATWALVILGYAQPSNGFEVTRDGPNHMTLTRGIDKVEVTQLETMSTDASPQSPKIPAGYQCCVPPAL